MIGFLRRLCREWGCEHCNEMHRRAQRAESRLLRVRAIISGATRAPSIRGMMWKLDDAITIIDGTDVSSDEPKGTNP